MRCFKLLPLLLLTPILLSLPFRACAQDPTPQEGWNFGLEQDVLPYLTGGYFAGAWLGKSHLRGRAVFARVRKPDWILQAGFTNNRVSALALLLDYFPKQSWKGWWAGAGCVYWYNTIQSDLKLSEVSFRNVLLSGNLGYNWKFWRKAYLSPWAGMHLRAGGPGRVTVDGRTYKTPLLNPEASLKLGIYF